MATQTQGTENSAGHTPKNPQELFAQAVRQEEELSPAKFEKVRDTLIWELAFPRSYFPAPPPGESAELMVWRGQLYTELSKLLREAPNDDTFWWRLALWLRYEAIRDPQSVLPPPVWRRLTKDANRRLAGILMTDDYNVMLVRIWLPYCEPLVRTARWLRSSGIRNRRPPLRSLGYDSSALDLLSSQNWTSPVKFTCAWVERRSRYRASSLRNSYSRLFGTTTFRHMECAFCENPAEDEFWAYGSSVVHCATHKADSLPRSQENAWPDRFGHAWWRDNLEIHRVLR